jgi:ATP synthase protein I
MSVPRNRDGNSLNQPIRERRQRLAWAQRHGERSIGQNLAMIGSLGWLIVVPMLAGVFLGGWIDRRWETGILWTAALLFLGLLLGCYLAWKRMHRE